MSVKMRASSATKHQTKKSSSRLHLSHPSLFDGLSAQSSSSNPSLSETKQSPQVLSSPTSTDQASQRSSRKGPCAKKSSSQTSRSHRQSTSSSQIQLRQLPNEELLSRLETLVDRERRITAEIIDHIKEVERRRLYLQEPDCTSIFDYLTKKLKYANGSAQRRIDAARLMNDLPELKEGLQSGSLKLMQLAVVAQCVRQKEKEMPSIQIEASDKREIFELIKDQDLETTQKIIAQHLDLEIKAQEKKRVQKDESVRLEITLSKEQFDGLKRVKELISHVHPNPSWAELFDFLGQEFLKKNDPLLKAEPKRKTSKTAESKHQPPPAPATPTPESSLQQDKKTQAEGIMKSSGREKKSETDAITKARNEARADARGAVQTSLLDKSFQNEPVETTQAPVSDGRVQPIAQFQMEATEATQTPSQQNHFQMEAALEGDSSSHLLAKEADTTSQTATIATTLSKSESSFEVEATTPHPTPGVRTHTPAATRRFIFRRDLSCRWRDPKTGEVCGSRFQLEVDHLTPVWAGGTNEVTNLELKCRVHNQLKYRNEAGLSWSY